MRSLLGSLVIAFGMLLALQCNAREFPRDAKYGEITQFQYPKVRLGEHSLRMAPGGKIYNESNLIIQPVAMPEKAQVLYRVDMNGDIAAIWLLSAEELKAVKAGIKPSAPDSGTVTPLPRVDDDMRVQ